MAILKAIMVYNQQQAKANPSAGVLANVYRMGKHAGNITSVHWPALPQERKQSNPGLNLNGGNIYSQTSFRAMLRGFSRAKFPLWRIWQQRSSHLCKGFSSEMLHRKICIQNPIVQVGIMRARATEWLAQGRFCESTNS